MLFSFGLISPAFGGEAQWTEIQSPHFQVITDAGEKRGREVAMRFEQMRAVFATLMTKANVNLPIPLEIVAFRNTKELRQVAPLWHGKPIQVAGLFQSGQDRSFIMLDMSVENPWSIVFHEYAHQLMNGALAEDLDPWFEEGFAEYFSSIEVDDKQARVGKVPQETYDILQQQGMMKVIDLFKVQHNSATYNETGDRRTVFYAESGMLMHYLYDKSSMPKLAAYFTLKIDKGVPIETAIQQSLGMSVGQLDKELRLYASGGRYAYYAIPSPPNVVSKDYAARPLSSTDAEAVVADIHLHSPDYRDRAVTEFQSVLKEDPSNAAACRGLGYAYLQQRDMKQAGEYFRRAAQANSKDPRVHYYSALLVDSEGSFADESKLTEMVRELEAAISLDPSFADAYSLMGFAKMRAREGDEAIKMAEKAVSLSPRNENYKFNLAQIYMSNQQQEKAIPLLQALQKSSEQQVALRASELLGRIQQFQEAKSAMQTLQAAGHSVPTKVIADRTALAGSIENEDAPAGGREEAPTPVEIKFLKGSIVRVDCSIPPSGVLEVSSGGKTWQMRVPDIKHTIVLGAPEFSCAWAHKAVALNYQQTADSGGTVISVEIE